MMPGKIESPKLQMDYRAARRAFIAACEAAGVETVARLPQAKVKTMPPASNIAQARDALAAFFALQ